MLLFPTLGRRRCTRTSHGCSATPRWRWATTRRCGWWRRATTAAMTYAVHRCSVHSYQSSMGLLSCFRLMVHEHRAERMERLLEQSFTSQIVVRRACCWPWRRCTATAAACWWRAAWPTPAAMALQRPSFSRLRTWKCQRSCRIWCVARDFAACGCTAVY